MTFFHTFLLINLVERKRKNRGTLPNLKQENLKAEVKHKFSGKF